MTGLQMTLLTGAAFAGWGSAIISGVLAGAVAFGVAQYTVRATKRADRDARRREILLSAQMGFGRAERVIGKRMEMIAPHDTPPLGRIGKQVDHLCTKSWEPVLADPGLMRDAPGFQDGFIEGAVQAAVRALIDGAKQGSPTADGLQAERGSEVGDKRAQLLNNASTALRDFSGALSMHPLLTPRPWYADPLKPLRDLLNRLKPPNAV